MGEVGWDDAASVAHWPGLPPLPGNRTADACVVGLGGSGLAAVDELVARGMSVIAVDAGRVAAGAAGRNAGFLAGGPAPSLHEAIADWGECAVDLYRATLAELDALAERLRPGVLRRVGAIRLAGRPGDPADDAEAADRATELADCAEHAAALRKHGIAVEEYSGPLGQGLFLPDDAAINPAVHALELAGRLEHRATLHEHTRVHQVRAGQVITEHGTVSAGAVVVAVDGNLERLVPKLKTHVRTARLQMLATAPVPAGRLPCPVFGRWGYDFAQQSPDGRLFVGGGRDRFAAPEWTPDTAPTEPVQRYIEQLAGRMAGIPVQVTHRWAASVGFTDDGRPVCARIADGVAAVGGYSGTGNLVGPVAARAAVALACDGTPPPDWCCSPR